MAAKSSEKRLRIWGNAVVSGVPEATVKGMGGRDKRWLAEQRALLSSWGDNSCGRLHRPWS